MTFPRTTIAVLAVGALLASCATAQKLGAANDVHALLISIRDNDEAAFEAHVDRPALKRDIQARIEEKAAKRYGALAALAPGLAEFAGDTLIQPSVFKLIAQQYGYSEQTQIPGPIAIAQALKPLPDGRVCAVKKKDGPCTLVFTKEDGVWRLTGFEGDMKDLKLKL